MKSWIIIIMLLTLVDSATAQDSKRTNIWYFGRNAGIDFNNNPPTPLTDGLLNTLEGCATICDTAGQLLMYTEGSTIWNKNHQIMPGAINLGGDDSSTQSGIFVPKPNSPNEIYLFSVDAIHLSKELNYSIVDMNLNGGLGGIISSNILLLKPSTEKITAIKHCNNVDFWIIAHEYNSSRFFIWKLTELGLQNSPMIIDIGSTHGSINTGGGYLKASPNGEKLALAILGSDIIEIFDFDNQTGILSNPITINGNNFEKPYGIEFSPNGKLLYFSGSNKSLYQINLSFPTTNEILASLHTIINSPQLPTLYGAIQLRPDGKLYISKCNQNFLAVIHNPNEVGSNCNFEDDYFHLNGKFGLYGLPNFIPSYFSPPINLSILDTVNLCRATADLTVISSIQEDSIAYEWYVNNQLIPGQHSNTIIADSSGEYKVKLLVFNVCNNQPVVYSTSIQITLPEINHRSYIQTEICLGNTYEGYAVTGIYTDTLIAFNGCDSFRTIDLTVLPDLSSYLEIFICDDHSFEGYTSSGVYTDMYTAVNGCDSIRTLNLTVLPTTLVSYDISICNGEVYEGYSSSGIYSDIFTAVNGCDSSRTLNLTVLPKDSSSYDITICNGEVYEGYSTSGIYIDIFTAVNGCDSIRTLNLMVLPKASATYTISICADEVYEGYATSGIYSDIFTAVNGCDSIRTLNLTVLPKASSSFDVSICSGEVYEGYSLTGTYTDIFTAVNGCDSIRTLNLSVLPEVSVSFDIFVCNGEGYEGYSTSGTYTDVFTAFNGCDSIRTLNLTVLSKASSIYNISICDGEEYEGYSTSGNYTDIFPSINGCDSTRILDLTVLSKPSATYNISVCDGEIYEGYSTSGTFSDVFKAVNGCDSIRTLNLTVLPKSSSIYDVSLCEGETFEGYSTSGTYTNVFPSFNGCDSTRTIHLKVNQNHISHHNIVICPDINFEFAGQFINEEGIYADTLSSLFGCDSILNIEVKIIAKNRFLGSDVTLCNASEYELKSPSASTIWFDNKIEPSKKVQTTGWYNAEFTDDDGCRQKDTIYVQFNTKVVFPNIFNPYSDRNNVCFGPHFFEDYEITKYRLTIYDRWSNLVFSTTDTSDCWNGEFKNSPCNQGVYIYIVEMSSPDCGSTLISGDVTLIR